MQRIFLFFIMLTISGVANAQSITNVRARQEDKKIIISYDIIGDKEGVLYQVNLFVSEDGGNSWKGPMTAVTGDAGNGIKDGISKQITWDVLNEPGREQLKGNKIAFKIQAIFYPGQSASGTAPGTPCPGIPTFTDPRDGQVYPTVQIGSQCWMQTNMNYNTGNSWCYKDNSTNCNTYGRLYDWETALKVCPKGWHLPSDEEWTALTDYLGGKNVAGSKMKSSSVWKYDENGINSSGFTALPGGNRNNMGGFYGLASDAYYWSSTEYSSTDAWSRYLYYFSNNMDRNSYYIKTYGFSARCIQD